MTSIAPHASSVERAAIQTVTLRLVPFLILLYLIAYVDRSNVGFAKLTLQDELGLSNAAFTLGQMAFFVAYAIFEVPSNIALEKYGARKWFARIMLTWGLVTVLTALVTTTWQFYLARFLLGMAEAGFFPGVLYFVTKWYPYRYRARVVGWFMLASPLAFIIGNPLLGALNDLDGTWGLEGWQWIFVATGVPAILLAPVTLWYLTDSPREGRWLATDHRDWLVAELAAEDAAVPPMHASPLRTLRDPRVVAMSLWFLCFPLGAYGLSFWLPTIVDGFGGLSGTQTGLITAIPYLFVAIGLWLIPRLADRSGTRYPWIWSMALLGAAGLAASALVDNHILQVALICVAAFGIFAGQPVLWSLPGRFLTGVHAATGIAMVNAIGNLGGGFGPLGIGVVVDETGSTSAGLWFLVAFMLLAAAGTFVVRGILEHKGVAPVEVGEERERTR